MGDLYSLQVLTVDAAHRQATLQIRAVNHEHQPIPSSPRFYLSVLADCHLAALTGQPRAPALAWVRPPPDGPPPEPLRSMLLEGLLDNHAPTLHRMVARPALLGVTVRDRRRGEGNCPIATVVLRAAEVGLLAPLVPGLEVRTLYGDTDAPLAVISVPATAGGAAAPRDPRLNHRLIAAIHARAVAGVRQALDDGANPDAGYPAGSVLLQAASMGDAESVALLLAAGANPDAQDTAGQCALTAAVNGGHAAVVEHLLAAGADANVFDELGHSPLRVAAHRGDLAQVQALLAHGALPTARNDRGWSALEAAIDGKRPEVVRVLLAAGADPREASHSGVTVLMVAVMQPEVVALLLEHGADPAAVSSHGETAAMVARRCGGMASLPLLEPAGAGA